MSEVAGPASPERFAAWLPVEQAGPSLAEKDPRVYGNLVWMEGEGLSHPGPPVPSFPAGRGRNEALTALHTQVPRVKDANARGGLSSRTQVREGRPFSSEKGLPR